MPRPYTSLQNESMCTLEGVHKTEGAEGAEGGPSWVKHNYWVTTSCP